MCAERERSAKHEEFPAFLAGNRWIGKQGCVARENRIVAGAICGNAAHACVRRRRCWRPGLYAARTKLSRARSSGKLLSPNCCSIESSSASTIDQSIVTARTEENRGDRPVLIAEPLVASAHAAETAEGRAFFFAAISRDALGFTEVTRKPTGRLDLTVARFGPLCLWTSVAGLEDLALDPGRVMSGVLDLGRFASRNKQDGKWRPATHGRGATRPMPRPSPRRRSAERPRNGYHQC